ncbi:frequency clock protein [Nemania abortiva]|nr:frequency clock protein [Nemania abortiva]
MADPQNTQEGINLPPTPIITYTNPRRTTPENSITLRHHRIARDGSRRHPPPAIPNAHSSAVKAQVKHPRRNSSDESNETGWSDPRQWFEQSNQNAKDSLYPGAMDVDPPFFQKETDSSNEETHNVVQSQTPAYRHAQGRGASFRPSLAKSSSADDYRSVIDDLTIENKRLREELRKLKQMGPDSLRNDKLFEVKVHGLPSTKKRELEATLRDFTTKLERSSTKTSTSRKKTSGKSKEGHSSASKHPSSTSGSNSRPVDSAYASMGTGQSSSSHLLPGQARAARLRSNQNIEDYLRDIPEGLWPKPARMTEHEKKKLVVKRLERLFTGKMGHSGDQPVLFNKPPPIGGDVKMEDATAKVTPVQEAAREAMIRTGERRPKTSHSHAPVSASNTQTQSQSHSNSHSYADQSNSRDNDKDSGSGSKHGSGSGERSAKDSKNTSPQDGMQPSEQRPTRPRDLDPDRRQVPADNMEYIRHLGIVAPNSQPHFSARDVSPDAEGWVYLNLLGNLAQLHILNVTPDFIRRAVSEKSTKFQLSPDGRKIRWRGGDEGTRFTSDSCSKSPGDQSSDDTDGSNEHGQRKKQKRSKFNLGAQDSNSSDGFHYKPLFVHHSSSSRDEQPSGVDDSGSSNGQSEDSNLGHHSRWDQSGVSTGLSQRKRRRDGAIIYYSGAPFCTDLSGDYRYGEVSPDTYDMTSSGDQPMQEDPVYLHLVHRPYINRSPSGSSIPFKPLSELNSYYSMTDPNGGGDENMTISDSDDSIDADFGWSDTDQQARLTTFEASGLGGVYPDDHFIVVVSTRRPTEATLDDDSGDEDEDDGEDDNGDEHDDNDDDEDVRRDRHGSSAPQSRFVDRLSHDTATSRGTTDSIAATLALMATRSPVPRHTSARKPLTVKIGYMASEVQRLQPIPLPPPAFYHPSTDSDSDDYGSSSEDDISVSSERSILSKRPIIEGSLDSDNRDLSGNDEEDEHSDGGLDFGPSTSISRMMSRESGINLGDGPSIPPLQKNTTGSSVATAGGLGSGYYSSMEDA